MEPGSCANCARRVCRSTRAAAVDHWTHCDAAWTWQQRIVSFCDEGLDGVALDSDRKPGCRYSVLEKCGIGTVAQPRCAYRKWLSCQASRRRPALRGEARRRHSCGFWQSRMCPCGVDFVQIIKFILELVLLLLWWNAARYLGSNTRLWGGDPRCGAAVFLFFQDCGMRLNSLIVVFTAVPERAAGIRAGAWPGARVSTRGRRSWRVPGACSAFGVHRSVSAA